jgi:precorrin-3B C17-methyltransferase
MNKLLVVGMGPGDGPNMTPACLEAITQADVVVGYTKYVDLVKRVCKDKRTLDTPMTKEVERCRAALSLAEAGSTVAIVCSGDAGVYGMASLVCELAGEQPSVEIEVIPGVTAALSGAAALGAPLSHDFAVISLSDLLTPWEMIERRLLCAAMGDFCVALYNPASKKRAGYLKRACELLMRYKPPKTVCGIACNIGREGARTRILTLEALQGERVDMFTTVFIGNAQTVEIAGRMVTPRGYGVE